MPPRRHLLLLAALLLLPAAARAAEASKADAGETGEQIYEKKCLACHGADGGGDKPLGRALSVPDLRTSSLTEAEIEKVILEGRGRMGSYRHRLTPDQVDEVTEYVTRKIRPHGPVPRVPRPPQ
jgi:mono/diheme cytochrome c family protein